METGYTPDAKVAESGEWSKAVDRDEEGSPQGGDLAILANLYLPLCLGCSGWSSGGRKQAPAMSSSCVNADDAVLGFEQRAEAERFLENSGTPEEVRAGTAPGEDALIEFGACR